MKFSYIFSERMTPVGTPVQTIRPSLTVNVSGATFTGTQPERSLPLKSETNPSASGSACAEAAAARTIATSSVVRTEVMGGMAAVIPRREGGGCGVARARKAGAAVQEPPALAPARPAEPASHRSALPGEGSDP